MSRGVSSASRRPLRCLSERNDPPDITHDHIFHTAQLVQTKVNKHEKQNEQLPIHSGVAVHDQTQLPLSNPN